MELRERKDALQDRQRVRGQAGIVTGIRFYRIALVTSLIFNALLVTAFWLYVHFAGTLSMIEDVVGYFN
jgi:hypothetical protein